LTGSTADPTDDGAAVTRLLGRVPLGKFSVVVRRPDGQPMVIANEPLLRDGTPMPTRFWLVDPDIRDVVARLESQGGVKEAQSEIEPSLVADAHARYAQLRDALLPVGWTGPRPDGGVGGTREGVKCLHAHVAWWLTGADDPVGGWVATRLGLSRGPLLSDDSEQ
jgi:hypothetical protein